MNNLHKVAMQLIYDLHPLEARKHDLKNMPAGTWPGWVQDEFSIIYYALLEAYNEGIYFARTQIELVKNTNVSGSERVAPYLRT